MEGVQDNSRLPSAKLINDESINDDITVPSSKYTRKSGGKRSKRMTTLKKPNSDLNSMTTLEDTRMGYPNNNNYPSSNSGTDFAITGSAAAAEELPASNTTSFFPPAPALSKYDSYGQQSQRFHSISPDKMLITERHDDTVILPQRSFSSSPPNAVYSHAYMKNHPLPSTEFQSQQQQQPLPLPSAPVPLQQEQLQSDHIPQINYYSSLSIEIPNFHYSKPVHYQRPSPSSLPHPIHQSIAEYTQPHPLPPLQSASIVPSYPSYSQTSEPYKPIPQVFQSSSTSTIQENYSTLYNPQTMATSHPTSNPYTAQSPYHHSLRPYVRSQEPQYRVCEETKDGNSRPSAVSPPFEKIFRESQQISKDSLSPYFGYSQSKQQLQQQQSSSFMNPTYSNYTDKVKSISTPLTRRPSSHETFSMRTDTPSQSSMYERDSGSSITCNSSVYSIVSESSSLIDNVQSTSPPSSYMDSRTTTSHIKDPKLIKIEENETSSFSETKLENMIKSSADQKSSNPFPNSEVSQESIKHVDNINEVKSPQQKFVPTSVSDKDKLEILQSVIRRKAIDGVQNDKEKHKEKKKESSSRSARNSSNSKNSAAKSDKSIDSTHSRMTRSISRRTGTVETSSFNHPMNETSSSIPIQIQKPVSKRKKTNRNANKASPTVNQEKLNQSLIPLPSSQSSVPTEIISCKVSDENELMDSAISMNMRDVTDDNAKESSVIDIGKDISMDQDDGIDEKNDHHSHEDDTVVYPNIEPHWPWSFSVIQEQPHERSSYLNRQVVSYFTADIEKQLDETFGCQEGDSISEKWISITGSNAATYKCLVLYIFGAFSSPFSPYQAPLTQMNGYEPISPQISKLNPPTIPFTESLRDLKIVSELVKEGIFRELIVGYLRRNEIILNLRLDLPPCPDGYKFSPKSTIYGLALKFRVEVFSLCLKQFTHEYMIPNDIGTETIFNMEKYQMELDRIIEIENNLQSKINIGQSKDEEKEKQEQQQQKQTEENEEKQEQPQPKSEQYIYTPKPISMKTMIIEDGIKTFSKLALLRPSASELEKWAAQEETELDMTESSISRPVSTPPNHVTLLGSLHDDDVIDPESDYVDVIGYSRSHSRNHSRRSSFEHKVPPYSLDDLNLVGGMINEEEEEEEEKDEEQEEGEVEEEILNVGGDTDNENNQEKMNDPALNPSFFYSSGKRGRRNGKTGGVNPNNNSDNSNNYNKDNENQKNEIENAIIKTKRKRTKSSILESQHPEGNNPFLASLAIGTDPIHITDLFRASTPQELFSKDSPTIASLSLVSESLKTGQLSKSSSTTMITAESISTNISSDLNMPDLSVPYCTSVNRRNPEQRILNTRRMCVSWICDEIIQNLGEGWGWNEETVVNAWSRITGESSNAYKCLCIYLFGGYANPRAPRPRDPLPHMLSYPYQPLRICIDYDLGGRVIPVGTLSGPLLDQDTIEQLWKEDRLKWLAAAWVWRGVLIMDLKLDLPPPPEGMNYDPNSTHYGLPIQSRVSSYFKRLKSMSCRFNINPGNGQESKFNSNQYAEEVYEKSGEFVRRKRRNRRRKMEDSNSNSNSNSNTINNNNSSNSGNNSGNIGEEITVSGIPLSSQFSENITDLNGKDINGKRFQGNDSEDREEDEEDMESSKYYKRSRRNGRHEMMINRNENESETDLYEPSYGNGKRRQRRQRQQPKRYRQHEDDNHHGNGNGYFSYRTHGQRLKVTSSPSSSSLSSSRRKLNKNSSNNSSYTNNNRSNKKKDLLMKRSIPSSYGGSSSNKRNTSHSKKILKKKTISYWNGALPYSTDITISYTPYYSIPLQYISSSIPSSIPPSSIPSSSSSSSSSPSSSLTMYHQPVWYNEFLESKNIILDRMYKLFHDGYISNMVCKELCRMIRYQNREMAVVWSAFNASHNKLLAEKLMDLLE